MCVFIFTIMYNLNGWIKEPSTLLYISFYHFIYAFRYYSFFNNDYYQGSEIDIPFSSPKNESTFLNVLQFDVLRERVIDKYLLGWWGLRKLCTKKQNKIIQEEKKEQKKQQEITRKI